METKQLTITRLGTPKTVNYTSKKTGQPDSFNKIGFQVVEFGDRWFDLTFRGQHGLVVGQKREFELSEREYNGKTYYDARLPKQHSPGASEMNLAKLHDKLDTILAEVRMLRGQSDV